MEDIDTNHHTGHTSNDGAGPEYFDDCCKPPDDTIWTISDHAADRMVRRFRNLLTVSEVQHHEHGYKTPIKVRMAALVAQSRKTRELNSNAAFMRKTHAKHGLGTVFRNFDEVVFVTRRGEFENQIVVVTVVKLSEQLEHLDSMMSYKENRKKSRPVVRKKAPNGRTFYRAYIDQ